MLSLLLWLLVSPAAPAESGPAQTAQPRQGFDTPLRMPNLFESRADCVSIPRQVAGEDKEYRGTRLDQLPPGKLLHAVEREVDGCPVVTFVAEERRRQLSGR